MFDGVGCRLSARNMIDDLPDFPGLNWQRKRDHYDAAMQQYIEENSLTSFDTDYRMMFQPFWTMF